MSRFVASENKSEKANIFKSSNKNSDVEDSPACDSINEDSGTVYEIEKQGLDSKSLEPILYKGVVPEYFFKIRDIELVSPSLRLSAIFENNGIESLGEFLLLGKERYSFLGYADKTENQLKKATN